MSIVALCTELELDKKNYQVPEWIELIPAGPEVKGVDGRKWNLNEPKKLVEEFTARNRPMVVDYEHSTQLKGNKGEKAPAAGWINKLEVREGGSVWGNVEWVESAFQAIKKKEYRYISPVFNHLVTGDIIKITSAALTNKPNLVMTALNFQEQDEGFNSGEWGQVAQVLGIESISSPNDVLQALNVQQMESLNREYETQVIGLVSDGFIAPCEQEFFVAACRAVGPKEAKAQIGYMRKCRPAFAHLSKQIINNKNLPKKSTLTDQQKSVCKNMGISESQFSSYIKGDK